MDDERGGIVFGWLVKLVVSIAIFGLVAFEAGAVIVARVTVESVASDAANEAALSYGRDHDAEAAEQVARDYTVDHGAILERFVVSTDGRDVSVTVAKKAKTIFLHRIGATKSWAEARSTRRRPVV